MSYKDYQNTRDSAWRLLLDCGVDRLPVDINRVCRAMGVHVHSYDAASEFLAQNGLTRLSRETAGLAFFCGDRPVILFDGRMDPAGLRVTAAHELGHILLGHVGPGGLSVACRAPARRRDRYERAADQFAARLLAPACVLWGLGARRPEEIMDLCHISAPAAQSRARRMAVLYRRQQFLTTPAERAVYRQFLPFMSEYESFRQAGR